MALKSLKASITLQANSLDDAIVFLSQRFLRETKAGCRIVQTPTDVCIADVCQPLIDGWVGGRVGYGKGKIVLVFRSGQLALEADMLIYTPKEGDRFLYTKPRPDIPATPIASSSESERFTDAIDDHGLSGWSPSAEGRREISTTELSVLLDRFQALEAKLERVFVPPSSMGQGEGGTDSLGEDVLQEQFYKFANILMHQVQQQTNQQISGQMSQQIAEQLGAYLTGHLAQQVGQSVNQYMGQQVAQHVAIALEPILQQLDDLQDQVENLADYVAELDVADFDISPPAPRTDAEWIERIEATWGTVGDYEKYSPSYRDANAETPLQETPDWIALCEFDWAWKLCPTLATLYNLIRGANGIGDEGADILQQFGQHIDPKTGDSYYVYQLSGYTALDALRQIVHNPDHSWLPELNRLWAQLADPSHPIFQLFGWEAEAIAALGQIVSASQGYPPGQTPGASSNPSAQYSSQSGYSSGTTTRSPTLRDYQAILNLGPFTPITEETIKRAYRQAMKAAHPDAGGSTEYAQQVNAAYAAVMMHYFPEASNSAQ